MKKFLFLISLIFICGTLFSEETQPTQEGLFAEMQTTKGKITFSLDYENAPLAVTNFVGITEGTLPSFTGTNESYFINTPIIEDIQNYVLLFGKSQKEKEKSWLFPSIPNEALSAGTPGALLMDGRSGQCFGSNFIMMKGSDSFLDKKYTVFGKVVSGIEIIQKLGTNDKIEHVTIVRKGEAAEQFKVTEESFLAQISSAREKDLILLAQTVPQVVTLIKAMGIDYRKSTSGVYYQITKPGTGSPAKSGQSVSVHYKGSFPDGTVFDSSFERKEPFNFVLGEQPLIPGWLEALYSMTKGEKRRIIIPPEMGYGAKGYGPIPPDSWLIFDVEMIDIRQ